MLFSVIKDAVFACVISLCIIFFLVFLFNYILSEKRGQMFSIDNLIKEIRSINREGKR